MSADVRLSWIGRNVRGKRKRRKVEGKLYGYRVDLVSMLMGLGLG